jgi:heme-degrading monooxygenase HmoA
MQTNNGDAHRTSDTVAALERPSQAVVVATRFVVRRRRDTLPFLRAALASGREAEEVPGFLGGTVLADLWHRRFWTVSLWTSPEAVQSYGSAPAHAEAMRRTEHWAAEAQVERWRTAASEVPAFAETATRFGVAAPRRGLVRHLRSKHPSPVPANAITAGPGAVVPGSSRLVGQHHCCTETTRESR